MQTDGPNFEADLRQLVGDIAAVTGAAPPALLAGDSAVPDARRLAGELYFIGLIGGKDVGKSSLVNALVGADIVRPTAFGRGTSRVTAYVHRTAAAAVRDKLAQVVPDQFDLVPHDRPGAEARVLLDLPDVDSLWDQHVALTRQMLRLMLYPVWVQSVEKYADRQPLELLRHVAEGNDPANFLFVLNKVDYVAKQDGPAAVGELAGDYAGRIARVCQMQSRPRVFATCARRPGEFDLPALLRAVSRERSPDEVRADTRRLQLRQAQTIFGWIDQEQLPARVARAARLLATAQEAAATEVGEPVLEVALPRIVDDPARRAHVAEPATRARVRRWPVVNLIDLLASPVLGFFRANRGRVAPAAGVVLETPPRSIAERVRGVFANLVQTDPSLLALYGQNKLWEAAASRAAADDLTARVEAALQCQRATAVEQLGHGGGVWGTALRWVLTVGALVWFPVVQPVLEIVLADNTLTMTRQSMLLVVQLLGATYLLHSVSFLAVYFLVLWALVRWGLRVRTDRTLAALRDPASADAALNPAAAAVAWLAELLEPVRRQHQTLSKLAQRAQTLRNAGTDDAARAA